MKKRNEIKDEKSMNVVVLDAHYKSRDSDFHFMNINISLIIIRWLIG